MLSTERIFPCGLKFVIVSLILIWMAMLFPYEFSAAGEVKIAIAAANLKSFLAHVLLFVPFGIALTALVQPKCWGIVMQVSIVMAAGIPVAVLTEMVQIFLPSRSASLADVLANVIGVVVGFAFFHLWPVLKGVLTIRIIAACGLAYVVALCASSVMLQRMVDLAGWEDSFPLLVGNELTGRRVWNGHIYQLQIANHALSEEELARMVERNGVFASMEGPLVASYQFTGQTNFLDRSGHLPELVWRGRCNDRTQRKGAVVGAGCWLQTDGAATVLTRALAKTSQFTLAATLASADPLQAGPARIVSLSKDYSHRNFTLGQRGDALVFRLRTPLTGANGTNPELVVSNVFGNDEPLFIVATYDGSILRVFVNGTQRGVLRLIPEAGLFSHSLPVTADNMKTYMVLYYGLVFMPFGFLLAFFKKVLRYRPDICFAVTGAGIIVPAVALESVLMGITTMRMGHLLLGMIFTAGAMVLFPHLDSGRMDVRRASA